MSQDQLAELSRLLYAPVTISLYFAAAFTSLFGLTATVGLRDAARRGRQVRTLAGVLTIAGIATHITHEVVRGLAQDRLPLGNMFEVTSMMALVGVVAGVGYLQFGRRRGELNGFVLLAGGLLLAFAGLMYAEPGPLMPILDTWWRTFHVSLLVVAMGVFTAGFVFNGLYLLRDTADRARDLDHAVRAGSATAGAGWAGDLEQDPVVDRVSDGAEPSPATDSGATPHVALRTGVRPLRLAVGMFLAAASVSWVFVVSAESTPVGVGRFLAVNLAVAGAALVARWFVPVLPSTETLDGIAHRTIAFAFVLWTVGTIAGAMWAEQSWGRFWGWDPKETGAFLTWVAYAGYLHARATRGVKGRPAAWIGIAAYLIMMATYLIANYVIVGLHSYAGL